MNQTIEEFDGGDLGKYVVEMVSSAVIVEHEDVLEQFCRRDSKGFQVSTREIDVLRSSADDGPDLELPSGKQGRPARSFWKRTKKYVRQLFCCCCSSS
ncbi:unnamed protein product [Macrosiphum euphorbiae]|uniref:Uncharacterized protein n=1 Tax=Macrosiphum euphorbiae TaxID=13131 RepID=A0AAV0X990_9HEMI|nr:unnamed protein product [Macrosiphum euphorbiae]